MSFNDQNGRRRSLRLTQDPSNDNEHILIDLNNNPTPSPSPAQSEITSNSHNRFAMNLLSFSANDYEIQSPSNSSNNVSHPFNNNIINYSSNGTTDSNHSISKTSIAPPNILEAPINTSNVAELQSIIQALRMEVLSLRAPPNSMSLLSHMPNTPTMQPMTTNNNISTQQDVPILRKQSNNRSSQSMVSNNHKINRKSPDPSCNSQSFSTSTNNNEPVPTSSTNTKKAPDPPEDDPFQHLVCNSIRSNSINSTSSSFEPQSKKDPPSFNTDNSSVPLQTHVIASHVPAPSKDIPVATTEQINLQQALKNIVIQREHRLSFMNFKKDNNYMSWKMMCIGEASTSTTYRNMVTSDDNENLIWDATMGMDLERSLFMATVKAYGTDIYIIAPRSLARKQNGFDLWTCLDMQYLRSNNSFLLKKKLLKELDSITRQQNEDFGTYVMRYDTKIDQLIHNNIDTPTMKEQAFHLINNLG
jgi:hypothetical protein